MQTNGYDARSGSTGFATQGDSHSLKSINTAGTVHDL